MTGMLVAGLALLSIAVYYYLLLKFNVDETAETTKPLYKAFITFLPLPNFTKKVPKIDVNIQAPPIVKG